jgi:hypothetical protein
MIDYKYLTIASGATPIGSAGRAPDEELLWEDYEWRKGRKFRVHKLDISLPSGEQIQEPEDFRKSKNWSRKLKKSKIEEVEDIWSRSLMKSKFEEVKELMKSKIWSLETQPESATRIESRGYWRGYARWVPADWYIGPSPLRRWTSTRNQRLTWRRRRKALIRIRLELL